MSFTQDDLAVIDKAIASGTQEVRFQNRTDIYRSIDDLLKARAEITSYLAQVGGPTQVRMVKVYTKSGW